MSPPGVTAQLQSPVDRAQFRKASPGSKLFVAPVLLPGKVATVTAVDKSGTALPNTSVVVNGMPAETNQEGRARFTVPHAGAALVVLPMEDESKDVRVAYAITSGGAMVVDPALGKFVDTLFAGATKKDPSPRILYSPPIVQPGHPVSVIGMNFDGQPGCDKLLIDNVECEILAGSPASLLATLPKKLTTPGPVAEMLVTTRGESSTAVEVDTVSVSSSFDTIDGAADGLFKVDAAGTKLPVLLRYENNSPSSVSIQSSEGAQLPASGWAMTPGGSEGILALRVNLMAAVSSPVTVELAPDLAILPDAAEDEGVCALAKNLMGNRIVRLKRQLLAIESQIPIVQKERAVVMAARATANVPSEEMERLTATLNALSLRQARVASSLNAHKAIFLSVGASDEQYRTVVDEAAGGAYLAIERKSAQQNSFAANATLQEIRRQRRLAEPRMKLLPPEDWNGREFVEVATTAPSKPITSDVATPSETAQPAISTPLYTAQPTTSTTSLSATQPATQPVKTQGPGAPASTTQPAVAPVKPPTSGASTATPSSQPAKKPATPGKTSPAAPTPDEKTKKKGATVTSKTGGAKKPAAKVAQSRTSHRKRSQAAASSRRRQRSARRDVRKSTKQASKRARKRGG
jgi:hypothetical protein